MGKVFVRSLFVCAALGLASCTAPERADVRRDAENYIGAPIGPPAIVKGLEKAAEGPTLFIPWIVGLAGTALAGWVVRKFIQKKYATKEPE